MRLMLRAYFLWVIRTGLVRFSLALAVAVIVVFLFVDIHLSLIGYIWVLFSTAISTYYLHDLVRKRFITMLTRHEIDPSTDHLFDKPYFRKYLKYVVTSDKVIGKLRVGECIWGQGKEYIVYIPSDWQSFENARKHIYISLPVISEVNKREYTVYLAMRARLKVPLSDEYVVSLIKSVYPDPDQVSNPLWASIDDLFLDKIDVREDCYDAIDMAVESYVSGAIERIDLLTALSTYVEINEQLLEVVSIECDLDESLNYRIELDDCDDDNEEPISIDPDGRLVYDEEDDDEED